MMYILPINEKMNFFFKSTCDHETVVVYDVLTIIILVTLKTGVKVVYLSVHFSIPNKFL